LFTGTKQYHICFDDTLKLFEQITTNKDTYTSIFDSPILSYLKSVHDGYGTVFTMAVFWESTDVFEPYFNLSMATTKWKDEFIANSNWLKFTFHAWNYGTRYTAPTLPPPSADTSRNAFNDYETVLNAMLPVVGAESWLYSNYAAHFYDGRLNELSQINSKYGLKILHGIADQIKDRNYSYYLNTDQMGRLLNEDAYYDKVNDFLVLHRDANIERVVGEMEGTPGQQTLTDFLNAYNADRKVMLNFECHEWLIRDNKTYTKQGIVDIAIWGQNNGYISKFPDYNEIKPYYDYDYTKTDGLYKVFQNGAFVEVVPKVYKDGAWQTGQLNRFGITQ
jgi:hypothetical protein